MRLGRVIMIVTCLALLAGATLPLLAIIVRRLSFAEPLAATSWLAVGYGLVMYVCAVTRERGRHGALMITGITAGTIALAIWAWDLFFASMLSEEEWLLSLWTAAPLTAWLGFTAFLGTLSFARLRGAGWTWVRRVTVILGGLCALCIALGVCLEPVVREHWSWTQRAQFEDLTLRACGVLALLAFSGLLLALFSQLAVLLDGQGVPAVHRMRLTVVCPRCGRSQAIVTDGDACTVCGLRIMVTPT